MKAFSDPSKKDILSNLDNKEQEVKALFSKYMPHVIHEGEQYPDLICQMFLDWPTADRTKHTAVKSGVYPFPLTGNPDEYTIQKTFDVIPRFVPSFDETKLDEVKELYNGSIFPPKEYIDKVLSKRKNMLLMEFGKEMFFSIRDIFKIGGPGVYYWPICRVIKNRKNLENYFNSLDEFVEEEGDNYKPIIQEVKNKYKSYKHYSNLENSNTVLGLLNQNMKNERFPNNLRKQISNFKNQYNAMTSKIKRVRRGSMNQRNKTKKNKNTKNNKNKNKNKFV